jgi:hypothetical protein
MVDQARIPRPKSFLPLLKMIRSVDILFGLFALAVLGIGAAPLSDRFAIVQRLPDWLRILLCGVCAYLLWSAGKTYGRIH